MRVGRAGHVAHDARQVELQNALIFGSLERIGPEPGVLRVGLDQRDLFRLTPCEAQIVDGLAVDVEHGGGRAIFRAHVRDGRAVANGEAVRTLSEELHPGADHTCLAQELSDAENDVGRGDAGLALAGQFYADDVGQPHHRSAAEHDGLGLQPSDADRDNAERVDVRRVAIGANAGVREGDTVADLHNGRHLLQIDLVHDPVARRDDVHILERLLGPLDEVKAIFVAAILHRAVLLERLPIEAAKFDGQAMVYDELGWNNGVHLGWIAAFIGYGVAQAREIDECRLPQNVMTNDARRIPREIERALALGNLPQRFGQQRRIAAPDELLGKNPRHIGELVVSTRSDGIDRCARIEIGEVGAGKRLAKSIIHRRKSLQGNFSESKILTRTREGADTSEKAKICEAKAANRRTLQISRTFYACGR